MTFQQFHDVPLFFQRPTAGEAGQYRCNIRNEQGETNANLKLDFQQEEVGSEASGRRSKTPSRPGTPSKKHREGTPGEREKRRHKSKSREGSPRKHIRSRTATPTQEVEGGLKPEQAERREREPTRKGSINDLMGDKKAIIIILGKMIREQPLGNGSNIRARGIYLISDQ